MKTKIFLIISILFIVGFVNAAYVLIETSGDGTVGCYIVEGCDRVLSSPYANLFDIPLYGWGLAYYGVGILALLFVAKKKISVSLLFVYILIGAFASLYFLYIQAFVLDAFCSSCLLSAIITFAATVCVWIYRRPTSSNDRPIG